MEFEVDKLIVVFRGALKIDFCLINFKPLSYLRGDFKPIKSKVIFRAINVQTLKDLLLEFFAFKFLSFGALKKLLQYFKNYCASTKTVKP